MPESKGPGTSVTEMAKILENPEHQKKIAGSGSLKRIAK